MTLEATSAECCHTAVSGATISGEEAAHLAGALKALAEPTRLRLVSLVAAHDDGEACICDLTAPVGLSQPTVSHHMKVLVDAGLLTRQQRGKWAYYRLVPGAVDTLADALTLVVSTPRPQDPTNDSDTNRNTIAGSMQNRPR